MCKDEEGYRQTLKEKVKTQLNKTNDKDGLKEAVFSIVEYKLHDGFDVIKTCESLALNN
jgi:hypothetical protein